MDHNSRIAARLALADEEDKELQRYNAAVQLRSKTPIPAFRISATPGYGARLFLEDSPKFCEAHALFKKLCAWGGYDKKWRIDGVWHLGYEFPPETSLFNNNWEAKLTEFGVVSKELDRSNKIVTDYDYMQEGYSDDTD